MNAISQFPVSGFKPQAPFPRQASLAAAMGSQSPTVSSFQDGVVLSRQATLASAREGLDRALTSILQGSPAHQSEGQASTGPTAAERANQEAVESALRKNSSAPVEILNNNGQSVRIQLSQIQGNDTHHGYRIGLGSDQLKVYMPHGQQPKETLAKIADFYSQQPENLRAASRVVVIANGNYGAREGSLLQRATQGRPGVLATADAGKITFYHGGVGTLTEHVFNHEHGHNVGYAIRNQQKSQDGLTKSVVNGVTDFFQGLSHAPRGHTEAIQRDNRTVSPYGDTHASEDFAETYHTYRQAMEAGPQALRAFQNQYPARHALLQNSVLSANLTP